ncbi:flavodoxin family protein [Clostridium sp. CM028]|uniref:flavodoxin family protein n=1 Tax=unclassified Clostridium TaxID=2614128 RepID=UPI001C0D0BAB|nr:MULTISPECIES: flavodoxin family protein [unclassified Clostridium]MBU3093325.1 flavodoxin family protein [Clostridium sp. CF011]MBW9147264.1 flavodoxin family protein [Clostridium sp. CM027]MBW9150436.1 flavodoxin family protein [Clostridium sp. CM028]UVE41781.1 flavodoxin family protein [Clostridium sp. CM027]WAG70781.1 flavodoxin family protein [Clostridium sp. CF011]
MKVVAINGSPNKEGNTYHAIKMVANELEKEGIETEIIHVGGKSIRGCTACNQCAKNKNEKCVLPGDDVNEWIQKMNGADGIILGSPVHYASIGGTMKSFLDRAFYVAGNNEGMLRHKVGVSVIAVRRSGGIPTFNQINNYINYSEMLMPTSNYWNVIHGTSPGEALQDEEGVQIMRVLGKNMAWLMKLVENGKENIKAPEREEKIFMNFIR